MRIDCLKRVVIAAFGLGALTIVSVSAQNEDNSVEGLYQKAGELSMAGQPEEASKVFEKMFDLSGGVETLFEDYGAAAGGFLFDYGVTLLPQSRWEDAKKAFADCLAAAETAKRVESPVKSTNQRESLARFQLGFCEAQLGNHAEAIRLYDEYLAANPPPQEVAQIRNSFKLRYGGSLMKLGRFDDGLAAIQELFDNREAWKVSPQFLMQGVLELGLVWVEQAKAVPNDDVALEKISETGHAFLDKNGQLIHLDPLDQFRFGFGDRLRKLGFESTTAGLYTLALRYLSYVPTIADIRNDLNLSLGRQPVGAGIPSQFQAIMDQLAEREKAPLHPDAETLRLVATCFERMGNLYGPRVIYWNLSEQYPEAPEALRGEFLHEAARLSSMLGDFQAAQYFGEKFTSSMPEDSPLRNNISTFMLQSLFTSRAFDEVIRVSERVRERFPLGDPQRELADALYSLALYSTQKHKEAEPVFAEYVKSYPDGGNREIVLFHRASNSLILRKMREAAEQYEDFLKEFPDSERFLANVLADLSIARFNLEDYPAAILNVDRLAKERPDSIQVGRTQNVKGDALLIQSGQLGKDQKDEAAALRAEGLKAYLAAIEGGKAAQASDPGRNDFHKETVAEGIWKAADIYYTDGEIEKGLALYDSFFPDYAGTAMEPQISIFSLEHLEAANRGEEGLVQVEKMILLLGNKPPAEQQITLLRQAIGSYSEASVRIRGLEKTLATLDKFPGMDPANQALLTWLKIQKVIVLQESRKKMEKDSPEYAAVEAQIAAVFEDLRLFEKRNLSEFALQQIGIYFSGTDNPFLAVPYFEELLARTNPEADPFKGPAEMELGKIEMRSPEAAKVQSARERFRRIIDKYKDKDLIPDAYLNLADLHIKAKEWKDALTALDVINKQKDFFGKQREKRAEAGFKMGLVLDELGEPASANQAYLSVVSTYAAFYDWVTQAWERYIPNSLADMEKMEANDPLSIALKRERQLTLYKLCQKYIYQWQKLDEARDAPSGALARLRRGLVDLKAQLKISPEEEQRVLNELGIAPKK
ncbi:MAG TPA: tetratricopeptide repeat protein [Verrucomicrobiales bacterium]|nr:tetratricopeptide repeat protein [Verrucomicrobiales bacterium]